MKDRIKFVRERAKLTQADFGKRIGVSQSTVAGYENGINVPRDSVVNNICREFCVDPQWLQSGEGAPFLPVDDDLVLTTILSDLQSNPEKNELIIHILKGYWALPEEDKTVVSRFIKSLLYQ